MADERQDLLLDDNGEDLVLRPLLISFIDATILEYSSTYANDYGYFTEFPSAEDNDFGEIGADPADANIFGFMAEFSEPIADDSEDEVYRIDCNIGVKNDFSDVDSGIFIKFPTLHENGYKIEIRFVRLDKFNQKFYTQYYQTFLDDTYFKSCDVREFDYKVYLEPNSEYTSMNTGNGNVYDFIIGDSIEQNEYSLLVCDFGHLSETVLLGVGIKKDLNSPLNEPFLQNRIIFEFRKDSLDLLFFDYNGDTGEINVETEEVL